MSDWPTSASTTATFLPADWAARDAATVQKVLLPLSLSPITTTVPDPLSSRVSIASQEQGT